MKDRVSAFASFALDLHKRNSNFCRTVLKLIDKHLEEGKTAISLWPCGLFSGPGGCSRSGDPAAWRTIERGCPGILLFEALLKDRPMCTRLTECMQNCAEKEKYCLLSVSSDQCPAPYRKYLVENGLRDHLLIPLCYEKHQVGLLSIFRGKDEPYFTPEAIQFLQEAGKYISSIYYLDNRSGRNIHYYFHLFLEDMNLGAALIDKHLRILASNKTFNSYLGFVWKEGLLIGKIPEPSSELPPDISDPQKLIYHFGTRVITKPERLQCDCMLYNFRLYTRPLTYTNPFGEIETLYLIYVSQYKKIKSEETMDLLNELTPRETELLLLLTEGNDNNQIADKLHITSYTVKSHLQNIYRKLDVTNKAELITRLYGK